MEIDGVNISVDNIGQDLLQLLVGERWPNGDEGAMRELASTWNDAATQLEQIQQAASSAAKGVDQFLQGASAEAFQSFWSTNFDDGKTSWPAGAAPAALPFAVQFCKTMANALNSGATQIETTKDTIMGNIAILVATVAPQIAAGFFDFGATDATAISEILADKITMQLALDGAKELMVHIVLGAIEQGLMQAELNFIIQFKEVAEGHASGINWGEVGTSGLSGAAGGLLGGAFGAGLSKGLGKAVGSDIGKSIGDSLGMDTGTDFAKNITDSFVGKTLTGMASGGLTNATMDLVQNGKISASDFTNGSLGAVVGGVGEHFKGQGDTPAIDTANMPDPASVSIPDVSDHTNLSGMSMPTVSDHGILGGTASGDGLTPTAAPTGGDPGMSINPSQMEGMTAAPVSSIARILGGGGGATEDAGLGAGASTGSTADSIGLSPSTSSGSFGGSTGGIGASGGETHSSGSPFESNPSTSADPFGSTGSSGLGSIGSMGSGDSGGGVTSGGSLGASTGGGADAGINPTASAGAGSGSGVSAGAGLDAGAGGSGAIASARTDVGGPSASGIGSTGAGSGSGASFGAASRADAGLTGGSDAGSTSAPSTSQYSSSSSADPSSGSAGSGGGVGGVSAVGFVPVSGERVSATAGESFGAGSGDGLSATGGDGLSATGGDNFTAAGGDAGASAGVDTATPLGGGDAASATADGSGTTGADGAAAMPEGAGAMPSAGLAADAGVVSGGSSGRASAGSGLGDDAAAGTRPDAPSNGTGSSSGDGLGLGHGDGKSSGRFYGSGRDSAFGSDNAGFGRDNGVGVSVKDPADLGGWVGNAADPSTVEPVLDKPLDAVDAAVADPKAPDGAAPAPGPLGEVGDLGKPGAQDHPLDPAGDPNAADHPVDPAGGPNGQDHPADPGDAAASPEQPGDNVTAPLDDATAPLDPGAETHAPDEAAPEPAPDAATDTAGATDGTDPFAPADPRPDDAAALGSSPFDGTDGSTPDNRPPDSEPPAEQSPPIEPIQPDQFAPAPAGTAPAASGADGSRPTGPSPDPGAARPDSTPSGSDANAAGSGADTSKPSASEPAASPAFADRPAPDRSTPDAGKPAADPYRPDGLKAGPDAPTPSAARPDDTTRDPSSQQDPSTTEDPAALALAQQRNLVEAAGSPRIDDPGSQPAAPAAGDRNEEPGRAEGPAAPSPRDTRPPLRDLREVRPGRQGYVHPADQREVEARFPRDEQGNPLPFRDPRENLRILASNDGGPQADPFRGNNCADQSCSELENWYGNPQVSAPRYPEYVNGEPSTAGEHGGIEKIEALTGAKLAYDGPGAAGYQHLADTLKQAGHGAAAAIVVDWGDGTSHAFNAFNHEGKILWTDGQGGMVSEDTPLWPQAKEVWSVGLDADRNPLPGYEPLDAGQPEPETTQSPQTPDPQEQAQSPDALTPDQQQADAGPQQVDTSQPESTSPRQADTPQPETDSPQETAHTQAPESELPVQPDRSDTQAAADGDPRSNSDTQAAADGDPRSDQAFPPSEKAVAEPNVTQQPETHHEPVAQQTEPETTQHAPESAEPTRAADTPDQAEATRPTDEQPTTPETTQHAPESPEPTRAADTPEQAEPTRSADDQTNTSDATQAAPDSSRPADDPGNHDGTVDPEPVSDTKSAGTEAEPGQRDGETPGAEVPDPSRREEQPPAEVPRQRDPASEHSPAPARPAERSHEPARPAEPGAQPANDRDHSWIDQEHGDKTHNVPGGSGVGADGYRNNADLPEDIRLTPEKVATILKSKPEELDTSSKQRMKVDYEQHLTQRDADGNIKRDQDGNAIPLDQEELDAKLKQLRDEGELSVGKIGGPISNGKFAGQVVKFSPEWAEKAEGQGYGFDLNAYKDGVYYDLRGYPDLTPYAHSMVELGPEPKPVPGQDADTSDPVAWERDASQPMKNMAAKEMAKTATKLDRELTPEEQQSVRARAQRDIVATAVRNDDFKRANDAMRAAYGDQSGTLWDGQVGNAPDGWTWHHVPTNPGEPRRMILVPRAAHEGARHYGGIATKTATPSLVDPTPTLGYQHHVPGERVEAPTGHSQNPAVSFNPHPVGLSDTKGVYPTTIVTLPDDPSGEIMTWGAMEARKVAESGQPPLAGVSPGGSSGASGGGSP